MRRSKRTFLPAKSQATRPLARLGASCAKAGQGLNAPQGSAPVFKAVVVLCASCECPQSRQPFTIAPVMLCTFVADAGIGTPGFTSERHSFTMPVLSHC